jgi:ethanolamine utilization microcompartment shell protein EutS
MGVQRSWPRLHTERLLFLIAFVLLAALPVWAAPQSLPAGVPDIYDPAVRAQFRPVAVVNLAGKQDFPMVLLMSTSGEQPQAMLVGLDARNGKASWSLTTDPIILIIVVSGDAALPSAYVDIGFADQGRASGEYAAVGDVGSAALPELLKAVLAAVPGTSI